MAPSEDRVSRGLSHAMTKEQLEHFKHFGFVAVENVIILKTS